MALDIAGYSLTLLPPVRLHVLRLHLWHICLHSLFFYHDHEVMGCNNIYICCGRDL